MSIWKDNTASRQTLTPAPEARESARFKLFQDVWMNLIRARANYVPTAKFTTWLDRLAHNRLIDHYRASSHVTPVSADAPSKPELAPSPAAAPSKPELVPSPAAAPLARADTDLPRKESLIAADITIEGKIEGGGSVRVAGKFKGDVNVHGDLTIEVGAKLTGSVRADKVTIAGELEGNVEEASRVDLLQTGVVIGDLKVGSLTVAAGARMRGQAEFGWDDGKGPKAGKHGNGHGAKSGAGS